MNNQLLSWTVGELSSFYFELHDFVVDQRTELYLIWDDTEGFLLFRTSTDEYLKLTEREVRLLLHFTFSAHLYQQLKIGISLELPFRPRNLWFMDKNFHLAITWVHLRELQKCESSCPREWLESDEDMPF
ncbi:hypothetical protein [Hymenobacter jejuensis]|uniref:Uncharacterized protein n=1 Tax=Hymenobacter jejuensis TaxID=2502781 RepID=A0A5B8A4U3_9BACT|nr:hypothetical protein [Hymenobacter jejuensis]QDA61663.1 hypothetical protein FHG12_16860 [Hymenobacter jejuensis]